VPPLHITTAERRERLGARHYLAISATDVESVAADLVGLHSSDPAAVYLAAWARVGNFSVDRLEDALYEQRSLLRMLGMRRTMFVVTRDGAAMMDAACTKALIERQRRRHAAVIEKSGIAGDGAAFTDRVAAATLEALEARGEATAKELSEDVPELRQKIQFGEGKSWRGSVGLSTRVLFLLAIEGRIVRGRPKGSWISSQYRWAQTKAWLGGPLPELDQDTARVDLLRSWLRSFGPGTEVDVKWWTGWNLGATRAALADVGAVEVELDEGVGYVLEDDRHIDPPPEWAALLPGLDPTTMGWKERGWYLGDYADALFDRNGNAGPTVWSNGRVVGGWAQQPDGRVVLELLEPVNGKARAMIDAKATELTEWLDGVVVTPRFRTLLEKRLSS